MNKNIKIFLTVLGIFSLSLALFYIIQKPTITEEEIFIGDVQDLIKEVEIEDLDLESLIEETFKNEKEDSFLVETKEEEKPADFVDCLISQGVVVYSLNTCPACISFAKEFGGYEMTEGLFLDCNENRSRCSAEKQTNFVPEVQIKGELYQGVRSLAGLAEATGCQL